MTREQFDELIAEIFAYYTNPGSWFSAQHGLDDDWFERLEAVPYDEARAVFINWTYHGSPLTNAGTWGDIPAMLRKPWDEDKKKRDKFEADRRRALEDSMSRPQGRIIIKDSNLAGILKRVQRTPDDGLRQRIIDDYIKKLPAEDATRGPRYRCPLCLETGVVICYLPEHGDETTTFACHCPEGARYIDRKYIRYDPGINLRVRSYNFRRDFALWSVLSKSERWEYETGKKRISTNDFGDYGESSYTPVGGDFGSEFK